VGSKPSAPPFVSIIVPTKNRLRLLRDSIDDLFAQDYPADRYEVIVVDDGSQDETPEFIRQLSERTTFPRLVGIVREPSGPNGARNAGIVAAQGDPVCFVDDDVDVPPSWLSSLVGVMLRHPGPVSVGGAIRLQLEVDPPRHCGRESIGESELDLGPVECPADVIWSCNMGVWRAALELAGFFDERLLVGGDETEWERRLLAAGGRMMYSPDAWLLHRRMAADLTLQSLLRRSYRRGVNSGRNVEYTGLKRSYPKTAYWILRHLAHAATRRCSVGLMLASVSAGYLVGQAQLSKDRLPSAARLGLYQ
jgi:glycosyltransferase involved in cell wall biosynthesis